MKTKSASHDSTENLRTFERETNGTNTFLGKFPANPKIIKFPKYDPFDRKFRKFYEETQLERKFLLRNLLR